MLDLLNRDSGKRIDLIIQHYAHQPLIGRDLSDPINGIEYLPRARAFRLIVLR
jgi:hypothetical protein